MLTPDDLRGIAEELRALADDLYCGHTLSGEWCDDDAKREHGKLLAWADALVAVHAGPIKTHEAIGWSRLAAEISADYLAVVRERDALRTELREADSLHNRLADILHRSVANLRGEPPELVRWGCDDLPERVAMMRNVLRRADNYIRNRREPGGRVLRAIDRILGEAAPELGIDIDSLQCLADIRAAVGDSGQMMQPELVECIKRLRADAERYRWLRRKFCIISDCEGHAEFCPINLPRPTYIAPNPAIELDVALDRERLGQDGSERPPTPVGWSDTDWIKHLQEQEELHPLAGLHINQGSLDAAADAYEAEYNEALKQDAARYRWAVASENNAYHFAGLVAVYSPSMDDINSSVDAARAKEASE